MMHRGECVMDIAGEEKAKIVVDDIVDKFSEISIELGN